jgi:pimeloyl-ACP methyl ester carboxylesterase
MVTDTNDRRLAVFVHGFGSSERCWDTIMGLMRQDERVQGSLELACFSYPTSIAQLRFLRRIPRLAEVANALDAFLGSARFAKYDDITLVGHSQGGLVIHTYLAKKLRSGDSADLRRIREVITIATPHQGSTILSRSRKILYTFIGNPQELALRVHDPEIADTLSDVDERIESIECGDTRGWPVAIRCFNGQEDRVVPEASARGPFEHLTSVQGDHSTILQPKDQTDPRYDYLVDSLLEPDGHRNVSEVDLFEQYIKVEPLEGPRQHVIARYAGHERRVHTDNVARVKRTVTFSRKNRCSRAFSLRYGTRNGGFVDPLTIGGENEALSNETRVWEDTGTETLFKFTPKAGKTFTLDATVYKGFDVGCRDVHVHLGMWQARYKTVRCSLDLTAYAGTAWWPLQPNLRFYEGETKHDDLCRNRTRLAETVPPLRTESNGIWTWELHDLRCGVYDVSWDNTSSVATARASA